MRLRMDKSFICSGFIILLSICTAQGSLVLTGCTNAFVMIECPMDDTVTVKDVRITKPEKGSPCIFRPPDLFFWKVPEQFSKFCSANKTCLYSEKICEGKNECAFYADPHLIGHSEYPNINTELVITYECKAGKTRKAGIAILIIIALALTIAGGYLLFRTIRKKKEEPASTYAAFSNERRSAGAGTGTSTAQPSQVHLSVSRSTGAATVPQDQSNAEVTPSSGSVF